jgi:hypothetical protein
MYGRRHVVDNHAKAYRFIATAMSKAKPRISKGRRGISKGGGWPGGGHGWVGSQVGSQVGDREGSQAGGQAGDCVTRVGCPRLLYFGGCPCAPP